MNPHESTWYIPYFTLKNVLLSKPAEEERKPSTRDVCILASLRVLSGGFPYWTWVHACCCFWHDTTKIEMLEGKIPSTFFRGYGFCLLLYLHSLFNKGSIISIKFLNPSSWVNALSSFSWIHQKSYPFCWMSSYNLCNIFPGLVI